MGAAEQQRLIVFGCGYIGTAVARVALTRGVRVTALTRNATRAALLRAEGIATVVADLASSSWHAEIPGGPEYVLNAVSSGGGGLDNYRRSYVEGMDSIANWARRAGTVGTMVYTSSTAVYPQGGGATIDEAASTTGATERGRILLEAERVVGLAGERPGEESSSAWRRWFILRLAGIYGPQRRHLVDQIRQGSVSGVSSHHLNLVHRDDIVAAIWACFDAPLGARKPILNVADDSGATRGEIAAWLAHTLGLPPPQFTGESAGGRQTLTPDRIISNRRIKRELGWMPRFPTFREGYAAVLADSV